MNLVLDEASELDTKKKSTKPLGLEQLVEISGALAHCFQFSSRSHSS